MMSDPHDEPEVGTTWGVTDPTRDPSGESRARDKLRRLWQPQDLFHVFSRYPRNRRTRPVDRLAGILRHGLVAPALCEDGSVCPDLQVVVTGSTTAYDSLVFLHRFGAQSAIYTMIDPGRLVLFVDPEMPVLTPQEMGRDWVILCQDEVYVRDRIAVEKILGIAVHPVDVDSVLTELLPDLERLGIPLYLDNGTTVWPRG